MGLNPKAPAWTPGPSSSGDRRGDSLGRIRRVVHGVGTHKSVDGAETLGVGGLNLPKKKDKHRANLHRQRVQQAIQKKQPVLVFLYCVCVCVFFPSILDIKFVGRTSRGHTGGRSHRIFNPPSFCGACLDFCREKDSAIPFPRRP